VSFRMGPLLTTLQPSPAPQPAFAQAIACSMPAEQNGSWAWWEATEDGGFTGYELIDAVNSAKLLTTRATLREGALQLTINLKTSS